MLTRASTIFFRQTLFKTNTISQEVTTCRYIHLVNQVKRTPGRTPGSNSLLNLHRNYRVVGIPLVRYASTNETSPQTDPFDEIPDPPTPPSQEVIEKAIHPNGEATFESIGLGGYSPVGIIQNLMEFMHVNYDIPWWTVIVIGTLCVRTIIFPLVIKSQKNMIKFTNHMPKIQELQSRMTEAREIGDHFESSQAAGELMQYMKKNNISAIRNVIVPLVQAPIFLSFFLALRGMANTPVESMKYGGFWWLQDLTVHDPYYIMPIVTCVTMYITIELGVDGTNIKAMGLMRYILRALPFVILPFMINFPGAIVTYWASTNFVSLAQTGLLKIPRIRKALDMPILIKHVSARTSNKGFTEEVKQSWTNMKITKQLADRERADVIQFNSAGKGPLMKTFKYDPTKQKESAILTKQK